MPLVVYSFEQDCGANKAGDRVEMDPEQAQALVEAGILAEAEPVEEPAEEEVEEPVEEEAAITRAIASGFKQLQSTLVKTTQSAASVKGKLPTLGNFATPKQPVFKSQGEQLRAIYFSRAKGDVASYNKLNAYEKEMRQKSPLGANETSTAQGGYGVLPEFSATLWDKARNYPRLYEQLDKTPVSGNVYHINEILETALTDGSRHGGVRGYWIAAEGDTLTSSYPATGRVTHTLCKLAVFAYLTNELLEDFSYPIDDYLQKNVANEFVWKENVAVVSGSGSGEPVGLLNQPALVTQTKSANTAAANVGFDDLIGMYNRLWAPSRSKAVWLVNSQIWGTLLKMQFPTYTATTNIPAFGAFSYNAADPFPMRIFGLPVVELLNMPQMGNVGDIILADLSQLTCAEKPEMRVDVSDHLQFNTDQVAFRFIRRFDIRSPWTAALTPYNGSSTFSPFVALQTRGT